MKSLPIDEFHHVRIAPTKWLLFSAEIGILLLEAPVPYKGGIDLVTLCGFTTGRGSIRSIGDELSISGAPTVLAAAPLPVPHAEEPDPLFKEAIAALKQFYEPTPIATRPGTDPVHFKFLVNAAATLSNCHFSITCDHSHTAPIERNDEIPATFRRQHVFDDLAEWFRPKSSHATGMEHDKKVRISSELEAKPADNPTGHEKAAMINAITTFYRDHAAELGLTKAMVNARLVYMNIPPLSNAA